MPLRRKGEAGDIFRRKAHPPQQQGEGGGVVLADGEGSPSGQSHPYLEKLVSEIVEEITTPAMSDYEKAKAAFDYIITHVSMGEPIGLDLWRIHGVRLSGMAAAVAVHRKMIQNMKIDDVFPVFKVV